MSSVPRLQMQSVLNTTELCPPTFKVKDARTVPSCGMLLSVMASIPSEWETGTEEGSEATSYILGKISKLGKAVADRFLGKDGPEGSLLAEFLFFPNSHQKDQRNTKIREKVGLYPQTRLAC